jgi:hypothetical protein
MVVWAEDEAAVAVAMAMTAAVAVARDSEYGRRHAQVALLIKQSLYVGEKVLDERNQESEIEPCTIVLVPMRGWNCVCE